MADVSHDYWEILGISTYLERLLMISLSKHMIIGKFYIGIPTHLLHKGGSNNITCY